MNKTQKFKFIKIAPLASIVVILFTGYGFHNPNMERSQGGFWESVSLGMILTLVLWGLAIIGLISILKRIFKSKNKSNLAHSSRALEISRSRYAKGEIGRDKYETMIKDLND